MTLPNNDYDDDDLIVKSTDTKEDIVRKYNLFRQNNLHAAPLAPRCIRTNRALRMCDDAYNRMMLLAIELGYTTTRTGPTVSSKRYTQGGSISDLLEAVAAGLYTISRTVEP